MIVSCVFPLKPFNLLWNMPEPPTDNTNTEDASKTSQVNKETNDPKKAPVESSLTDHLNKKLLSSFLNRINEADSSENSNNIPGQNPDDFENNDDEWWSIRKQPRSSEEDRVGFGNLFRQLSIKLDPLNWLNLKPLQQQQLSKQSWLC